MADEHAGTGRSTAGAPAVNWLVDAVRREGVGGVALRVLQKMALYRRLIVIGGRDLRRPSPHKLPLEFSRLGPDGLDEYMAYRPDADRADIRNRLDEGQWCHVARHEGRIVASGWTACDWVWIDYVVCGLRLREDSVYAYDTHVRTDMRGEGLATAIEDFRRSEIDAEGYERTTALILPLNRAASRHSDNRSNISIGDLRCWRVGPWCHHSLRMRPSRKGPMLTLDKSRRAAPTS